MDADALQAVHSLITDLQSAADALDPAHGVEGSSIDGDGDADLFTAQIEADAEPETATDGLAGVVWASGQHNLWVNGEPAQVHVPEETISDTFERLHDRMQAEDTPVKIGFDHPEDDSVAAQTPLGEIGVAQEFTQDSVEGREAITMRDSELTNSKAVEAAAAGSFDDMGFSIVGNIALATDSSGQPVTRDDGSMEVAATAIHRVDVVLDQAVDGAKNGNLPALASAAEAAGLAASNPRQAPEGLVRTLRAAAGSIEADADATANTSHMTDGNFSTDPESLEAAQSALNQASETVEAKQEQIEEKEDQIEDLEAKVSSLDDQADHFRQIAASQGVDPDADDFEAQDVVDSFTEDLRAEIADLEASLPKYDTEDREARSENLEGKPISELEAMAGERWRQFGRSKAKRDELSAAVAADESVGSVEAAGGTDEDADAAARGVLRARELAEASDAGQSPAEYVEAKYGIGSMDYDSEHDLQAQLSGGAN